MRRTVVSAVVALVAYIAGIALLHVEATGQPPNPNPIRYVTADPTGNTAAAASIALRTTTGRLYTSQSGVYALVPAGAFAGSLAGDVTGTQAATVVGAVGGKAISLANSFTTSGNFPLTLTTTASTSITVPTSGNVGPTVLALHGNCSGPAKIDAASGIAVVQFGESVGQDVCNGTAIQYNGTLLTRACTLKNLFVSSSVAGAAAGDGIVTIWLSTGPVNTGSATAITCTLGTSNPSICSDTTHTAAAAAGNLVWLKAVTTSTNISNVAVGLDCEI